MNMSSLCLLRSFSASLSPLVVPPVWVALGIDIRRCAGVAGAWKFGDAPGGAKAGIEDEDVKFGDVHVGGEVG